VTVLRNLAHAAAATAAWASLSAAHAQVYKCTDASGKTTYGDAPCDATAKAHKLPSEPAKSAGTNPRVCDQLLDETRRLADEADLAAKRGGKESAEHFQRREKLTKQYEQRCIGISRSAPKQN
jgi:hypothetical protein